MSGKITPTHLARRAIVYVRQSSMTQVMENTESTTRQYALRTRALTLGWRSEDVAVIDEDLGRSGASSDARTGFARLGEEVARGRVGAILALEMSRLARSSADWQDLLRLCRVADVVVADEHNVYDPADPDDRLLLDLKGTMSEAELHWLGLRLVGARRSRARRGELRFLAGTGYVWAGEGFEKDPDTSVQAAIQTVFDRFEVEPSAYAVVRWARRTGFQIPTRVYSAGGHSEIVWGPLGGSRLVFMLRNPIYAGVYVWGRAVTREELVEGAVRRVRRAESDPSRWSVRLLDRHPGYISWEKYLANSDKLRDNHNRFGGAVRGASREGAALLAGVVVCGRCGRRMHSSYGPLGTRRYVCAGA
jgi:DNA invertase Pin-like site-specific DNA recombinase